MTGNSTASSASISAIEVVVKPAGLMTIPAARPRHSCTQEISSPSELVCRKSIARPSCSPDSAQSASTSSSVADAVEMRLAQAEHIHVRPVEDDDQRQGWGGCHDSRRRSTPDGILTTCLAINPAMAGSLQSHRSAAAPTVDYASATWSATYAPRLPSGLGGPSVLSCDVCNSSSAFSSAPSRTT